MRARIGLNELLMKLFFSIETTVGTVYKWVFTSSCVKCIYASGRPRAKYDLAVRNTYNAARQYNAHFVVQTTVLLTTHIVTIDLNLYFIKM